MMKSPCYPAGIVSLQFYSVVTVHGIRDDYKTAWIEKDDTWWLKNKLFKDLSIREVDYSYDIDEEAAIYEPNGIELHAERLLTAYAEDRSHLEEVGTPSRHSIKL